MGYFLPKDLALTLQEPNLLDGKKPVGPVEIDWSKCPFSSNDLVLYHTLSDPAYKSLNNSHTLIPTNIDWHAGSPEFNGTNSRLTSGNLAATLGATQLSVFAEFVVDSHAANSMALCEWGGANLHKWLFQVRAGGDIAFGPFNTTAAVYIKATSSSPITVGQRYKVACSWKQGQLLCSINGQEVALNANIWVNGTCSSIRNDATNDFVIGDTNDLNNAFDGVVYQAGVITKTLGITELNAWTENSNLYLKPAANAPVMLGLVGGGVQTLGLVTDTESAFSISKTKDKTLGLLTDSESIFSVTAIKTRDLGLLSDSESVFAVSSEKQYDLSLLTDTESVFGIDSVKTQELGLVSDSENVFSLNWDAVTTLGLVSDTETVYPIDNPGIIVLGLVVDTESVLPVSQQKESTLNLVTDTESVLPVSSGTAQTLGLVTDTEQVLSVSQEKQQTVGLVTDTESVLSVTGVSVRELGIITDSEISYPVDKIKWQQLGLVTSLETVFTLQGQQLIGLGAINDPAIYSMTTRKRIHSMTPERCVVGMG